MSRGLKEPAISTSIHKRAQFLIGGFTLIEFCTGRIVHDVQRVLVKAVSRR